MADSNRLNGVARENGWRERVEHFLLKRAAAVLVEATPDANELTLSKLLIYPSGVEFSVSPNSVVVHFSRLLVTVSAVSSALISNGFDHTSFSDVNFEAQVNSLWTDYAKAVT